MSKDIVTTEDQQTSVDRLVVPWSDDLERLQRFVDDAAIVHYLDTGTDTAAALKQALWWIQYLKQFIASVEHVHRVVATLSVDAQDSIVRACRETPGICFCGGHGSLHPDVSA